MAMSIRTTLLIPTVVIALVVMVAPLVIALVQAQTENMTMEELTNASLAQYPDTMENETTMEEETSALVGNMTGNMTGQNMTIGNMTG
jgi:ABC-type spermidine/putrescine transport system permease subunit II